MYTCLWVRMETLNYGEFSQLVEKKYIYIYTLWRDSLLFVAYLHVVGILDNNYFAIENVQCIYIIA